MIAEVTSMSDFIIPTAKEIGEYEPHSEKMHPKVELKLKLKRLWMQLGNIEVKCPLCSGVQRTSTTQSVACNRCGQKFRIYPYQGKSRVYSVPEGKLILLHQIRDLETKGKVANLL